MPLGTIIAAIVTTLLSIIIPVTVAVILTVKMRKTNILVVLMGVVVFAVFQIFTRIPLLAFIQKAFPHLVPFGWLNLHTIVYCFILALTAGLFEELGRFLMFAVMRNKVGSWYDGVGFGIGHGGIEYIYVAGLPLLVSVITQSLPSVPVSQFAISNIERIFALIIQIGFSILVLYGVKNRKFRFVILAIILHMIVDFAAVILGIAYGVFWVELFVGLCAMSSLIWIIKSRSLFYKKLPVYIEEVM